MPLIPNISMYCAPDDVPILFELLRDDLAFIAPDGVRRWRATYDCPSQLHFRLRLWHVPGGPISVISGNAKDPFALVEDPWAGWIEQRHPHHGPALPPTERRTTDWRTDILRPGIDSAEPLFAETQNLFSLFVCALGREPGSLCGLSQISWVGNKYANIGNPAQETTKLRWAKLKRDIGKIAVKVPHGGLQQDTKPEIWAFPHAAKLAGPFDMNSSLK